MSDKKFVSSDTDSGTDSGTDVHREVNKQMLKIDAGVIQRYPTMANPTMANLKNRKRKLRQLGWFPHPGYRLDESTMDWIGNTNGIDLLSQAAAEHTDYGAAAAANKQSAPMDLLADTALQLSGKRHKSKPEDHLVDREADEAERKAERKAKLNRHEACRLTEQKLPHELHNIKPIPRFLPHMCTVSCIFKIHIKDLIAGTVVKPSPEEQKAIDLARASDLWTQLLAMHAGGPKVVPNIPTDFKCSSRTGPIKYIIPLPILELLSPLSYSNGYNLMIIIVIDRQPIESVTDIIETLTQEFSLYGVLFAIHVKGDAKTHLLAKSFNLSDSVLYVKLAQGNSGDAAATAAVAAAPDAPWHTAACPKAAASLIKLALGLQRA